MSDYISREESIKSICERMHITNPKTGREYDTDIRQVAEALILPVPAADVREVRRGKWKESKRVPVQNSNWEIVYWECSECGIEIHTTLPKFEIRKWRYCVNCGALMEDEA